MYRLFMLASALTLAAPLRAQDASGEKKPVRLVVESFFFADNTEFLGNPFREGQTLLGSQTGVAVAFPLGDRAEVRLGAFGDLRAGSEPAFQKVRPMASLVITGGADRFVMGTLITHPSIPETGPERSGRHGLLPPLQDEHLAIERGYENGLQWLRGGGRLQNELWINWQLLNTPGHREKFDAGYTGAVRLFGPLSLGAQFHVVHHGGQLYDAGQPVSDSFAGGAGLILNRSRPKLLLLAGPRLKSISTELYWLGSSHVPDRSADATKLAGDGIFYRTTWRWGGWRAHVIRWWAKDFVKDEGDPNYGFLWYDGTPDPRTGTGTWRRYSEVGLEREFRLADELTAEAGARLHWVDGDMDYSYEIHAVLGLDRVLRR
ncbi:MAG TPA: hypothetical protein VD862_02090 [Candidatus Paceibacterota bacterium]|nr:hypothetical protein [Candidatus Paceibacterota bacterium]